MTVIISYSGGLTSFEAGRRAMELYGRDAVEWWFCDTRAEDPDLYRFSAAVERLLGIEIRVLTSEKIANAPKAPPGAALWDLFDAQGMIANTRADFCSRILKRELFRRTLEEECDPDSTAVVIGMDNILDCDRIERTRALFRATHDRKGRRIWRHPWDTWFPLTEEPIRFKDEIAAWLGDRGIAQPRLYDEGAPHNNCAGFCVKAGFGQFAWLYRTRPELYAYHADRERMFRARVGKNVSILRDRRGGDVKPLTLDRLRERIEAGEHFPMRETASCDCFSPSPQMDMFDMLGGAA